MFLHPGAGLAYNPRLMRQSSAPRGRRADQRLGRQRSGPRRCWSRTLTLIQHKLSQVLVWNLADADGGALLAGAAAGASPAPDSGRRASRLGAQLRLQARRPACFFLFLFSFPCLTPSAARLAGRSAAEPHGRLLPRCLQKRHAVQICRQSSLVSGTRLWQRVLSMVDMPERLPCPGGRMVCSIRAFSKPEDASASVAVCLSG